MNRTLVSVHVLEFSCPKLGKIFSILTNAFQTGWVELKTRPPEDVIFSDILGFDMPAH